MLSVRDRKRKSTLQQQLRALNRQARAAFPARPKPKRGRETDPGFLAYLRRQPCVACTASGATARERHACGPVEAAHIRYSDALHGRNPGMQRKNHDRCATPLGRAHHQQDQHGGSERVFWARLGIDPYLLAADLYAAFKAGRDGAAVIQQHAQLLRTA